MSNNGRMSFVNRPFVDLREGASILALAILVPMAIGATIVVVTWSLTTLLTGEPYPNGDNLDGSTAALLLLLTRFIVLSAWWIWLALKQGRAWWFGVLAALPLFGIIWALWLSAQIVRDRSAAVRAGREVSAGLVVLAIAASLLLPVGIMQATRAAEAEEARLAALCLPAHEDRAFDDAVVTINGIQIGRGELEGWVAEVTALQVSPVAQRDPRWTPRVLNAAINMTLLEELARNVGANATVAAAEARLNDPDLELDALAQAGVPASQLTRVSCISALRSDTQAKVTKQDGETAADAYIRALTELSSTKVTGLAEEFGYWNPDQFAITENKPAVEAVAPDVKRTFSTKVTYESDTIPAKESAGTLDYQADLCVGAKDLLDTKYLNRVTLYERVGGAWVKVPDAKAAAKAGGRCDGGKINLTVAAQADDPPVNWNDKGWTTCRQLEVRLPEMPAFRATSVGACVAAKADTENKGA